MEVKYIEKLLKCYIKFTLGERRKSAQKEFIYHSLSLGKGIKEEAIKSEFELIWKEVLKHYIETKKMVKSYGFYFVDEYGRKIAEFVINLFNNPKHIYNKKINSYAVLIDSGLSPNNSFRGIYKLRYCPSNDEYFEKRYNKLWKEHFERVVNPNEYENDEPIDENCDDEFEGDDENEL